MKPNYIGIIGGILAFVSLALPWWTVSAGVMGLSFSVDLYLYQVSGLGTTLGVPIEQGWFMWTALVLVIISGLLGILGSIKYGKILLLSGGALALLSIIIFALGLQMELSKATSPVGLFSFGEGYSTYLSFGFWLVLVGAILMLVASRKTPTETTYPTPTPLPPPPPPT